MKIYCKDCKWCDREGNIEYGYACKQGVYITDNFYSKEWRHNYEFCRDKNYKNDCEHYKKKWCKLWVN